MDIEEPAADSADANRVYSAPAEALDSARHALAAASATRRERAEALWTLGRSAYYANQMPEAVRLLREALPLADDPEIQTEILLTLAPALSKEGHPNEALSVLEHLADDLRPELLGQIRNQRGIILTELGRLPEAMAEMERALTLLEAAGDLQRQPRTLLNLGAVSSMMGDLAEAERWYGLAREMTVATGQGVLAASIEGNLGYVESRRGNYSKALDWYRRAGDSFEGLGDVALLVAVLEADHARTLLDLGLAADAADAAAKAAGSATAGGNQMLETQSRLLLAEACIQLGEFRAAEEAISKGIELAVRLGQKPWELRAIHLRSSLGPSAGDAERSDPVDEVTELLKFRWVREAYESALQQAHALRSSDEVEAQRLLVAADRLTDGLDVNPVDKAFGALLLADLQDDSAAASRAFASALDALAEQRDLMGSVEMRATITRRLGPIEDAALAVALRSGTPTEAVLEVLESTGAIRNSRLDARYRSEDDHEQSALLRSARVALEEAKLSGEQVEAATTAVRGLEQSVLQRRRTRAVPTSAGSSRTVPSEIRPPDGTGFATFTVHVGRVLAITKVGTHSDLFDLGPSDELGSLGQLQRASIRRLADERRPVGKEFERLDSVNAQLDSLLLAPLKLASSNRIVVAPSPLFREISWGALPSLQERPLTVVSTFGSWSADEHAATVRRVAVLGGPNLGLRFDELDTIAELWAESSTAAPNASCEEATVALATSDLVHVAAHGSFRTDNPFFSSLLFSDGDLSILEISALSALPAVVVLSSCDAAATARLGSDTTVVGTAAELRRLGASAVIAPTTVVNDKAAAEFSVSLHRSLLAGQSVDEAMLAARSELLDSGEPRRIAAAQAFHLFGGRSTQQPLNMLLT